MNLNEKQISRERALRLNPLVLAYVGFDKNNAVSQSSFAEQGILWLVAIIPAILLIVAMLIISKYELDDERIDEINKEIENRNR